MKIVEKIQHGHGGAYAISSDADVIHGETERGYGESRKQQRQSDKKRGSAHRGA